MKIIETANNSLFNFLLVLALSRALPSNQFNEWILNQSFMFLIIGLFYSSIMYRANSDYYKNIVHKASFVTTLCLLGMLISIAYAYLTSESVDILSITLFIIYPIHEFLRRYVLSFTTSNLWIVNLVGTLLLILTILLDRIAINILSLLLIYWIIVSLIIILKLKLYHIDIKGLIKICISFREYILTSTILMLCARSFFIVSDLLSIDVQALLIIVSLTGLLNPIFIYFDTVKLPNMAPRREELTKISKLALIITFVVVFSWALILIATKPNIVHFYKITDSNDIMIIILFISLAGWIGFANRVIFWNSVSRQKSHIYDSMSKQLIVPALGLNLAILSIDANQTIIALCFLIFNIAQCGILLKKYNKIRGSHV